MIEKFTEEIIMSLAYKPYVLYGVIITILILSSFGLPIPEEFTLVITGFACYHGANPDLFPPPYPGATPINPYTAAIVAFFAVFLSDYLIFFLGRNFGPRILRLKYFINHKNKLDKISSWVKRYGFWASGIFRFTPGLRFPGHFSCGMMGLAPWKFIAVDGSAALFSVPTQILLVTFYGKTILEKIKQFKIIFFSIVGGIILIFALYKIHNYIIHRIKSSPTAENADIKNQQAQDTLLSTDSNKKPAETIIK